MEWGGSGRVRYTEFQKQNQGLWIEWIHSRGLGTSSGHGGVWIGVLVRCYMGCNNALKIHLEGNTSSMHATVLL